MDVAWPLVCGRRLHRHGLTPPSPLATPAAAATAMCGAHAQIQTAAELSIALRVPGLTRAAVRSDPGLVKTFGPRGTVHLLPAADLPLWCGALSAVPPLAQRLPPAQTDELVAAIGVALTGRALTVDELTEALAASVGPWAVEPVMPAFQTMWPRWRLITETAAHRGVLCFGPNRGRNVTYTNPGITPAPAPEATAWLLNSYLHAYGPAEPPHFARWLAAPPTWARSLFASADLPDDTEFGEPARGVLLLPHFDAFVVGSQPRELLFPGAAAARALARNQAGNFPVLLVDGVVTGVWHQKKSAKLVAITVEPLRTLTPRELTQLDEQIERIGAILEVRAARTIGSINVGAHA